MACHPVKRPVQVTLVIKIEGEAHHTPLLAACYLNIADSGAFFQCFGRILCKFFHLRKHIHVNAEPDKIQQEISLHNRHREIDRSRSVIVYINFFHDFDAALKKQKRYQNKNEKQEISMGFQDNSVLDQWLITD